MLFILILWVVELFRSRLFQFIGMKADRTHGALSHTVHLPLQRRDALPIRCTMCGTGMKAGLDVNHDGKIDCAHQGRTWGHCHTVHLPLGALLSPCTMCG